LFSKPKSKVGGDDEFDDKEFEKKYGGKLNKSSEQVNIGSVKGSVDATKKPSPPASGPG